MNIMIKYYMETDKDKIVRLISQSEGFPKDDSLMAINGGINSI
jgi:hypothetical protein